MRVLGHERLLTIERNPLPTNRQGASNGPNEPRARLTPAPALQVAVHPAAVFLPSDVNRTSSMPVAVESVWLYRIAPLSCAARLAGTASDASGAARLVTRQASTKSAPSSVAPVTTRHTAQGYLLAQPADASTTNVQFALQSG